MSKSCCEEVIKPIVESNTDNADTDKKQQVCVGVARSVNIKTGAVTIGKEITDGWYGQVYVKDNCIVDVKVDVVIPQTSAPCVNDPTPCGDVNGDIEISSNSKNIIEHLADGLFAAAYIQAGDNISVSGNGTKTSPYVITAAVGGSGGSTSIKMQPARLFSVTTSSGTTTIEMKKQSSLGDSGATVSGITFNEYGIITSYSADNNAYISAVQGDNDSISVDTVGGVATVSLKNQFGVGGTVQAGGFTISYTAGGAIKGVTQNIALFDDNEQSFVLGAKELTLNKYGSVTKVKDADVEKADVVMHNFSKIIPAGSEVAELSFTAKAAAFYKVTLSGSFDTNNSYKSGIAPYISSNIRVSIGGISVPTLYAVYSGNVMTGIIAYSTAQFAADDITVSIEMTNAPSTISILDVQLLGIAS